LLFETFITPIAHETARIYKHSASRILSAVAELFVGLSVRRVYAFDRSFVQTDIVTTISQNGLSNFDETCSEHSLAPIDDVIRFWRSKVKVTAGCRVHFLVLNIFYYFVSTAMLHQGC